MPANPQARQSRRQVEGSARCRDCPWTDAGETFRMLAGRHHKTTGHEVVTDATTTYERVATTDPDQSTIFDFIEEAA